MDSSKSFIILVVFNDFLMGDSVIIAQGWGGLALAGAGPGLGGAELS